jgi:hypothetical protein
VVEGRRKQREDACTIYVKATDVQGRLHDIGLNQDDVRWAPQYGDQEAEFCTENDPRVLRNLVRWGKSFRGLADRLVSKGWQHEEEQNFPTMVAPDGSLSLTVSSGDSNTGRPDGPPPRSRNPKGPVTKHAVNVNQLSFADIAPSFPRLTRPREERPKPPPTWFLLYNVDKDAQEIRVELSLPARLDDSDHVDWWHERVILPPIPLTREPASAEEEEEEDIDITIERRSR